MKKKERIAFRVTVEEFEQINANAKHYGLGTGTYLRLLGMLGGVPYGLTEPQTQPRHQMEPDAHAGPDKAQEPPHGRARIAYWKNRKQ